MKKTSMSPSQAEATHETPYDDEGLGEETRAMLNAQIVPSTCSGYIITNIHLICFFQDNSGSFSTLLTQILWGILLLQMIRTVSIGQRQSNH
jgi:hypothetical protein